MAMCFVEAPQGLPPDVKRKLHEELYDAIFEAHHIPDIRTFIREYSPKNVARILEFAWQSERGGQVWR